MSDAYGIARTAPAGWTPLRWLRHLEICGERQDYGEQCADTDGTAKYLVSDGHEDPQLVEWSERSDPTNWGSHNHTISDPGHAHGALWPTVAELQARIARKEAANEALVAKLNATMADAQSLQRQNEQWQAECKRLSALLIEKERQLAQRMALPPNALKHGR